MKKLLSIGILLITVGIFTGCSASGNDYNVGKKSFVNKDYEEAAAYFGKAVANNPNRADYYIDYGMSLIALGKYEEALEQLDLAYMDKDIQVIRENNKRILRGKGIAYYELRQYEAAIEAFGNALEIGELSTLNVDILYYMGDALRMTGFYEQAADAYTEILSLDKKAEKALAERAYCYQCMGDYEKSQSDYDSAIGLNPKKFDYYFGKFHLLMDQGNVADALKVLEQAAQIPAKTSEDKFQYAKLHYYQGDYETALKEMNESFTSGFALAYYYIGEIYRLQENDPMAIYYYELYISNQQPDLPHAYNQVATCLIKTGDYEKALEYLKQGMEFHHAGTLQILRLNEIIVYERLGMFDAAKEKMAEYRADFPGDTMISKEAKFIDTRQIANEEIDSVQ